MPLIDIVQIVLLIALVVARAKPVGTFLYRLFSGERTFLHPVLAPVEARHLPRRRVSTRPAR